MRTASFALALSFVSLSALASPGVRAEPPPLSANQTARTLAGLDLEAMAGDAARQKMLKSYAKTAKDKWARYWKNIGGPMTDWSRAEVPAHKGETIFYPFSGPDFPTAMQVYPDANRYILVALQNAGPVPDLVGMGDKRFTAYMNVFKRGWVDFARRGFFRTDDLKADTAEDGGTLAGVTPVLMAFSSALGFSVESVSPIRINAAGTDLEAHPGDRKAFDTWKSVRLALKRADGTPVTLDYVQLDISDGELKKDAAATSWLAVASAFKSMTKAASHLMQKPFFSVMRDALVNHTPVLVQDETGVDYADLRKSFDVHLYGRFERAHKLFSAGVQRELAEAYKKRKDIKSLGFKFGYEKDKGSAVMIAVRK